jgi:hypothetical protein
VRGDRAEPLLQLVEGVPGSRQAAPGGRHCTAGEQSRMKDLRTEAAALKEAVADLTLENRLLKKSMTGGRGIASAGAPDPGCPPPPSTAGTTATGRMAPKASRTGLRGRAGSGTASPSRCGSGPAAAICRNDPCLPWRARKVRGILRCAGPEVRAAWPQPPIMSLTTSSWVVSAMRRSPALIPRRITTMRSDTAKMS